MKKIPTILFTVSESLNRGNMSFFIVRIGSINASSKIAGPYKWRNWIRFFIFLKKSSDIHTSLTASLFIYVLSIELMLLTATFLSTVEFQALLLSRLSSTISSSIFTMISMSYNGDDNNENN